MFFHKFISCNGDAHNRLKQDAHITPVEGVSDIHSNGVQNMLNHFIIVPVSC